jgi:hypothetical protein
MTSNDPHPYRITSAAHPHLGHPLPRPTVAPPMVTPLTETVVCEAVPDLVLPRSEPQIRCADCHYPYSVTAMMCMRCGTR